MADPAPVFLDYRQDELDRAYDQSFYAPNRAQLVSRYASNSEITRRRIGAPQRIAYGPSEIERLDFYRTDRAGSPTFIFVHGGAWRLGDAKNYAFPAEMFVRAGAHYAALDFVSVEDKEAGLDVMVNQVRRAVICVYRNALALGADPDHLFLGGHSSGAHLVSACMITDWEREFGVPSSVIKGALCSSGMYDLKPVRLSRRNSYLKLDDSTEHALSAQRHADKLSAPLIVSYGTHETPEFQRQAKDFAATARARGRTVDLLVGENYNHFEILETLANPYGLLGSAVLGQMRLSPTGP